MLQSLKNMKKIEHWIKWVISCTQDSRSLKLQQRQYLLSQETRLRPTLHACHVRSRSTNPRRTQAEALPTGIVPRPTSHWFPNEECQQPNPSQFGPASGLPTPPKRRPGAAPPVSSVSEKQNLSKCSNQLLPSPQAWCWLWRNEGCR